MSAINVIPEYKDFSEFYIQAVLSYKELNPTHIRLDGKMLGSTRNVSAYFWYLDKKWKVGADTRIDRLKLAFEACKASDEPFVIKHTRDKKGEYLEIKGQPIRDKKFYVYRA
ncbi:hypothetical protein [Pedobacter sp. V48]|uniref:hypothetical protein n=1 Tax=Pedobacter sp. V48 TaxID=509635 RepID=UPI0003E46DE7|nr:hypothetical protein [Pedobacter sp. V48]ETZ19115.1 hypothetical protein N824_10255 [Pedobacter sp. V48]